MNAREQWRAVVLVVTVGLASCADFGKARTAYCELNPGLDGCEAVGDAGSPDAGGLDAGGTDASVDAGPLEPPSALTYSPSAFVCTRGVPCHLDAPTSDGGAPTSYAVTPP